MWAQAEGQYKRENWRLQRWSTKAWWWLLGRPRWAGGERWRKISRRGRLRSQRGSARQLHAPDAQEGLRCASPGGTTGFRERRQELAPQRCLSNSSSRLYVALSKYERDHQPQSSFKRSWPTSFPTEWTFWIQLVSHFGEYPIAHQ